MTTINLDSLKQLTARTWNHIFSSSPFIKEILAGNVTKELYAIYMIETYHYTRHNARNQALVGIRNFNISNKYLGFCFHHAHEETGHENMAFSDVSSLGFNTDTIKQMQPLASTETLIAYLYWIAENGNPIRRLGYSFWAENCYEFIDPILVRIKEDLELADRNMKFFIAHATIDEKHADEVDEMLEHTCKTEQDLADVAMVVENSLLLTARILDEVYVEYEKFKQGSSDRYAFLKD